MAIFKIAAGIFTLSLFLPINALYNLGIATTKYHFILGNDSDSENKLFYCKTMSKIMVFSSIIFIIYSITMFNKNYDFKYSKEVAILIATVTFFEIGINIKGFLSVKKNKNPLFPAIKLANISSSITGLVLVQTALMSFTYKGDLSFSVGVSGIFFGIISFFIGIYMLISTSKAINGTNFSHIKKDLRKLSKEYDKKIRFDLVKYEVTKQEEKILYIKPLSTTTSEYIKIKKELKEVLNIDLVEID